MHGREPALQNASELAFRGIVLLLDVLFVAPLLGLVQPSLSDQTEVMKQRLPLFRSPDVLRYAFDRTQEMDHDRRMGCPDLPDFVESLVENARVICIHADHPRNSGGVFPDRRRNPFRHKTRQRTSHPIDHRYRGMGIVDAG